MKTNLKRLIGATALVIIWSALAFIINDEIILPKFSVVFKRICDFFISGEIFKPLIISSARIFIGVIISLIIGNMLAILAYEFNLYHYFDPFFALIRTIPVISIVLIVMFFANKNALSMVVVVLVTLPIVYDNVFKSLNEIETSKLELAQVFSLSKSKIFKYVKWPKIKLASSFSLIIAFGLAFKAGATSEVVAGNSKGIGELLYISKLTLEMKDLIALSLIIILTSYFFESISLLIYKKVKSRYD